MDSVINNSWGKYQYQLIVVDDGSTDGTKQYLEAVGKNEKIDLVLKVTNEGTLLSRIDGANIATGKYITFLDADDSLVSGIDKRLDEVFSVHADIIEFYFNYCYEDGRKEYRDKLFPVGEMLNSKDYVKKIIECEMPVALWHRYYSNSLIKKLLYKLERIENFRKIMYRNVYDDHFLSPIIFDLASSYYISKQFNCDYTIFSGTSVQKRKLTADQIKHNLKQDCSRYKIYLEILDHSGFFTKFLKKKKNDLIIGYFLFEVKWAIKKMLRKI